MALRHFLTANIVVLVLFLQSAESFQACDRSEDEIQILQLLVSRAVAQGNIHGKVVTELIVLEETKDGYFDRSPDWQAYIQPLLPDLKAETINDFAERLGQKHGDLTSLRPRVTIRSIRQLDTYFKHLNRGWALFYKAHPAAQGITMLSRVGFSSDGTQALVFSATHREALAAEGKLFVFKKELGQWVMHDELSLWVS